MRSWTWSCALSMAKRWIIQSSMRESQTPCPRSPCWLAVITPIVWTRHSMARWRTCESGHACSRMTSSSPMLQARTVSTHPSLRRTRAMQPRSSRRGNWTPSSTPSTASGSTPSCAACGQIRPSSTRLWSQSTCGFASRPAQPAASCARALPDPTRSPSASCARPAALASCGTRRRRDPCSTSRSWPPCAASPSTGCTWPLSTTKLPTDWWATWEGTLRARATASWAQEATPQGSRSARSTTARRASSPSLPTRWTGLTARSRTFASGRRSFARTASRPMLGERWCTQRAPCCPRTCASHSSSASSAWRHCKSGASTRACRPRRRPRGARSKRRKRDASATNRTASPSARRQTRRSRWPPSWWASASSSWTPSTPPSSRTATTWSTPPSRRRTRMCSPALRIFSRMTSFRECGSRSIARRARLALGIPLAAARCRRSLRRSALTTGLSASTSRPKSRPRLRSSQSVARRASAIPLCARGSLRPECRSSGQVSHRPLRSPSIRSPSCWTRDTQQLVRCRPAAVAHLDLSGSLCAPAQRPHPLAASHAG
mmetsp:Transcript_22239/g.69411  ORF Transcript_22239/g.69411 Transcript_22239/m.69411 type:complete len:547 (+) Transcript_22239:492-2132(+)